MKKNTIIIFISFSLMAFNKKSPRYTLIKQGKVVIEKVYLAKTQQEIISGLSNIRDDEFTNTMALLFEFPEEAQLQFWMYNTFFDLDLIILDKDLNIVGIEKKMKANPSINKQDNFYTSQKYRGKYALEIKSKRKKNIDLKLGEKLSLRNYEK